MNLTMRPYNMRGARSARGSRHGMTLIEIMIVVVLIGVTMAVAFPTMSTANRKNRLRAMAREVVALSKAARAEAVFGERTTELILDLDKQQFWVDLREPEPEKKKRSLTSGDKDKKKTSKIEEKHDLPAGITFDAVQAYDENILKDKLIAIDFHPDGSASPTLLSLKTIKGETITIEILKATGNAEVSPGTIEEKQAAIENAGEVAPPPPGRSGASGV